MPDKLIFVLDTGEQIPAEKITKEQVSQAIALIKHREGQEDSPVPKDRFLENYLSRTTIRRF